MEYGELDYILPTTKKMTIKIRLFQFSLALPKPEQRMDRSQGEKKNYNATNYVKVILKFIRQ